MKNEYYIVFLVFICLLYYKYNGIFLYIMYWYLRNIFIYFEYKVDDMMLINICK